MERRRRPFRFGSMLAAAISAIMLLPTLAWADAMMPNLEGYGFSESVEYVTADDAGKYLLIRGGTVVNADRMFEADVLVRDGAIVRIEQGIQPPVGAVIIDATAKLVIPGGIDPHVHLEMPFMGTVSADDYFTGTAAALAGGTTLLIDFAIPLKGETPLQTHERYLMISNKTASDVAFHMVLVDWNEDIAKEVEILAKEQGINSVKLFMAYKNALMVSDEQLFLAFEKAGRLGMVPMVHAENGDIIVQLQRRLLDNNVTAPFGHPLSRPSWVEGEATHRAITIAKAAKSPLYVVHVMSIDAMEEIQRARHQGQRVVGEALLAGLTLDETVYSNPNFTEAAAAIMSPPLRPPHHKHSLLSALKAGTLRLVGTDHCVFNSSQKAAGKDDFTRIPNGINGVEDRMSLFWHTAVASGHLSPMEFVRSTSTEAAQIFNLYPRFGVVAVGSEANLVVFDPQATRVISAKTHHMNTDVNVYEGWNVTGVVDTTIYKGQVVYSNGTLHVKPGNGRLIRTPPFPPYFYA